MFGKKSDILKNLVKGHVVLSLWLIFATGYVIFNEYNGLKLNVANRAYNQGLVDAVDRMIDESAKCQPLPINVGEKTATLINLDCLPADEETEE